MLWWIPATGQDGPTSYFFDEGNLAAYFNAADDKIYFTDGTNTISTSALTFSAESEHFLAFTWSSSGLEIWRNPASDTADASGATYTAPTLGANLYVGSDTASANQANGLIDDLAIIDRALDADEIRAIYESNAPVFAETSTWTWRTPNTLAWADSEGLWAIDDSGNASFGISGVDSKSWGGQTLNKGDVLIGDSSSSSLLFDSSAGTIDLSGQVSVQAGSASTVGLVVDTAASPTANIAEFRNNGTAKLKVGTQGTLDFTGTMGNSSKTVGTDAPADWVQVAIGGTTYYLPAYSA